MSGRKVKDRIPHRPAGGPEFCNLFHSVWPTQAPRGPGLSSQDTHPEHHWAPLAPKPPLLCAHPLQQACAGPAGGRAAFGNSSSGLQQSLTHSSPCGQLQREGQIRGQAPDQTETRRQEGQLAMNQDTRSMVQRQVQVTSPDAGRGDALRRSCVRIIGRSLCGVPTD